MSELELAEDMDPPPSILVSKESRFSPMATCQTGDFILFKSGGGIQAGKVQLHCEVQDVAITMIEEASLYKLEPNGFSLWVPDLGTNCFVETCDILDTVVHSQQSNGKIAAILPVDLRG